MPQLTIQQAFELGLQHHEAGRLPEAEQLYRQILAVAPQYANALHFLGVLANQTGHREDALKLIQQSIALNSTIPAYYINLGNTFKDMDRLDDAVAAYRTAIRLDPGFSKAHNNLANILRSQGRLDEAIASFRSALKFEPNFADAHNNLGVVFQDMGRLDDAIASYRTAIQHKPAFAEAYNNLGNALKDQGRLDEAVASFRTALQIRPAFAEAHNNLGVALKGQGKLEDAIASYRAALELDPDSADAHNNLGNVFKDQGQLEDAIASFRAALRINPNFAEAHSNFIYLLHFHPGYSAQAIAEAHREWNQQHAEPLKQYIKPHRNDRTPDRKLRIGYISPDFFDHVVGRNLLPLFTHHDRHHFDIFTYAQVISPDALTQCFREQTDHWRNIVGRTDEQVDAQIREDQIDILVDLTLHMAHNRLRVFARKPAPIQVTFAGYPGSTGLPTIDYRLSDPYLDPPGMDESIYSEQTIRLPDSFWCYDPMDARDIPVQPLRALQNGFITFGCLNNFCKVNAPILKLWSKVLRAVENSRLLLLSPEGNHRQQTLDLLRQEGIASDRVDFAPFLPRRSYLELFHRIDIGLDSAPYNGHTTSLDSLWMGAPVVTLVGQTAVSRAGWCQLSNLGLPELAGHSPEEFVNIAIGLANDLPRLADLRATLRARMQASPLMDAPRFTRNIEAAYRQMWRKWCEEH